MSDSNTQSSPSNYYLNTMPQAARQHQLLLQGALSGGPSKGFAGGLGNSTLKFLTQQDEQLRNTRLLIQHQQHQQQQQQLRNALVHALPRSSLGGGSMSGLSSSAAEEMFWPSSKKTEDVTEAEDKTEEEEDDQLSDEEYFEKFALKGTEKEAGGGNTDEEDDAADIKAENESFPHKLYRMLHESEREGHEHVVSFLASGRGFTIHEPKDFASIMGRYFTTRRLASFQRQLNLYGFRRISAGKEKGGYFHEHFTKGKRHLIKKIRRKSSASRSKTPAFFRRLSTGSVESYLPPSQFPVYGNSAVAASLMAANTNQYRQHYPESSAKEMLLAHLANHSSGSTGSSNLGSLMGMTREGLLASQSSGSPARHQDVLRNAASSILWARHNSNPSL